MSIRRKEVVLYLFSVVFAFLLGYLLQPKGVATVIKKDLAVCLGSKVCTQGALSVFSKEIAAKAQALIPQKPGGYCLMVPVLLYHHVQPQADAVTKGQTSLSVDSGIFDQQMGYVASHGYTAISAAQLVNAIVGHTAVPAKSIVLTFDDAYLDNFIYAYPVLQKYHLVGNLMVPTGLLGGNGGTNSYYSIDQLKQMVGSGMMFAYDHTWSHFSMAAGPVDKDVYEATTGQSQLQQYLGHADPIFVYPYGSGQTTGWVQQLLKSHGFIAAFSTLPGVYQCEGNIMALPRLHIGNAPLSSYGI